MKKLYGHGLVLGKFYPLHAGHSALINRAIGSCDKVTVQLLANQSETIPMDVRKAWLQEVHPEANITAGYDDHPVDFDDPAIWDLHMEIIESLLDSPVDAVFTSDDYGQELARRLGAEWVQVDPRRRDVPMSGTQVRQDPAACWWALSPPVRSWYTRRIVVLGAESTGTTTLARALAEKLKTLWVPEFGREWSLSRPGGIATPWHTEEFLMIAAKQCAMEEETARKVPVPWLVCDTNALATTIWHERYMGCSNAQLIDFARERFAPALYLLTSDDIPFYQDGLRDGEHLRPWMTQRFREILGQQSVPWVEVRGTVAARMDAALEAIREMDLRRENNA